MPTPSPSCRITSYNVCYTKLLRSHKLKVKEALKLVRDEEAARLVNEDEDTFAFMSYNFV